MTILAPAKIHLWETNLGYRQCEWGFHVGILCGDFVREHGCRCCRKPFSLCFDNPFPVEWRGFDILSSIYQQSIHPSINLSIGLSIDRFIYLSLYLSICLLYPPTGCSRADTLLIVHFVLFFTVFSASRQCCPGGGDGGGRNNCFFE